MLIFKQLFFGLLLPAIAGSGIFILAKSFAAKRSRDQTEERNGLSSGWLFSAALSVGYIVGYIGLEGLPPFPPREGVHWLCYLALIGLILGVFWHFSLWGRLISQIVISIVVPRLLLGSMFKYSWGQVEGIIWWVCIAVTIFIFWQIAQESFAILPSGAWSPFVYFGLSGGTALILAVSGSLRLAQHAGILVALFAAIWIITLVAQSDDKVPIFPIGASAVIALALTGIWMNGYFYEEVPTASAALLLISLFLTPVGRIRAIQRLGARRSTFVQIAVIALPVVIAIGIAVVLSGLFGENRNY
ncbi:hypothetical protein C6503_14055 [Candidatus Poribacteria bacterium]|nr:MAG: hypothetical protein C6503_14055 [Candidatus Poribacteria bacterium]